MIREEYPHVYLGNGMLDLGIYLPDPEHGFYRGVRFDRSGIIGRLHHAGHDYIAEWIPHDPADNEAVTGPADEFRHPTDLMQGGGGYEEAGPGDPWLKPGVGVLGRIDERPFHIAAAYPVLDAGQWTVSQGADRLETTHLIDDGPGGWGYRYTRRLGLDEKQPGFSLSYTLENTGRRPIDLQVYNHNFFFIDRTPVGPDYRVCFPFEVQAATPHPAFMRIEGREVGYAVSMGEGKQTLLLGFSASAADHAFSIENRKTGAGLRVSGDRPLSAFNFWSIRTTICPEPFIRIQALPGATASWSRTYTCYLTP